ncbi:unnamed protein product [Absidia cylindrospora]
MDMMNGTSSNRDSAIYTKASDLQQLQEELEILRQKRKSRRCSQKSFTAPKNPIIENVSTKAEETPNDSPSPETPLPSSKKNDDADIKKSVPSPQQLITLNQQDNQPPKTKSQKNQPDISPITTPEPRQTVATEAPIKPKRLENRPVPIITNLDKNESKIDQQKESQEPHSILLKKLQSSTDKRDNRKMNRLKANKAKASISVTESNERDLTEELLLTAFSNLNSQSTPTSQSTPISQFTPTNKLIDSNTAPEIHKKFATPKSTSSSRPAPSQKVPSWKKQSSLKKLQFAKGKVSTAINALENGKPTTSYRINKPNKLPRPLAEYELPSPYHQQTFNIGVSLSTEVAIKTQRSHSNLDNSQPQVQQQQTRRQDNVTDSQTIQRTPHAGDLNSPPSSGITTPPQPKQRSSCRKQRNTKQNDERRHCGSTQISATSSIPRSLPSYTPQLSPLAGKCDHNLTGLLPSPKQSTTATISTLPSPEPSSPPLTMDARKAYRLPPTPPPKHCDRSISKSQCPSHQQNSKRPPLHHSLSNNNNNNNPQRQLRVINIDKEDLGSATRTMMDLEGGTAQAQRGQRRYNELFGSADDSSDDSSLSDENAMDANHQYYDMNKNLPATMMMKPTQPRKRYSSDNNSTLSYHHHHPHQQQHHHYEQYTGMISTKGRPERRKRVSFSSVVTTIPTQSQSTSSTLSLDDYPENTRGFWEAFSAEMGHHQHQQTLLDQLDAMKSHNSNNKLSPSNNNPLPPLPPTPSSSSSSKLINKLWNKSQPKKVSSSSSSPAWWKPSNNNDHISTTGDRPVSHSPPLNHPTKHRPKKPSSFRKASNRTVVSEPQWRQRVPVSSKHHHHHHPHLVS